MPACRYPLNDTGAPTNGPCVTPNSSCSALNTWNGPIVDTTAIDQKYHMFNPLYRRGSLLGTQDMMYGTAERIEGPYNWESMGNMGSNPAFVTYTEDGKTKYSLWVGGKVHVADTVAGPYTAVGPGPGGNPAPIFRNGTWFATSQRTSEVVTTTKLGKEWTKYASIEPKLDRGTQEDPFMYIDKRGNWHIINHVRTAPTGRQTRVFDLLLS